ncbi:MAG TPA: VWA domain-containing protein [Tepidisphaeraceae bacterium]|nr:VWA domain-containing protein [Tepidisphaeraceae bacterium]
MPRLPFSLGSPWVLAACLAIVAVLTVVAARRHPAVARSSKLLALLAAITLSLAGAGLAWHRPATADLVVMVDCSPSTRGATFRDRAKLEERIRQLVDPAVRYEVVCFGAGPTNPLPAGSGLPDLPADRTVYVPPAASAVLLFSDARFAPPAFAPPTFVVADPALDRPTDAAVLALRAHRARDGTGSVVGATVRVVAPPSANPAARPLTITPATADAVTPIEPSADSVSVARAVRAGAALVTAAFGGNDLWPENDALAMPLVPPESSERWFVSAGGAAPAGWVLKRPAELPAASASSEYLVASIIALDNLPASAIPADRQLGLQQYVRDLGGALLITGGDRAFAAGMYPGTAIDALSPLASAPPEPTTHWVLLADSSGSMAQPAGDGAATRWQRATQALVGLLPTLPPDDPVSLGSFAADVSWWTSPALKPARELAAAAGSLPPRSVAPGGPTNLVAALQRIAREVDATTPTELLVLSDADVQVEDPAALAAALKTKRVRLHLLAVSGAGAHGLAALRQVTEATGGTLIADAANANQWSTQVRQLLAAAFPNRLSNEATPARFVADLAALGTRPVSPWNRTWLRPRATVLAQSGAGEPALPLAARQSVGAGEVLATAFAPSPDELEAIAARLARPPRDPRFAITWTAESTLAVRVDVSPRPGAGDATDASRLAITLTIRRASGGAAQSLAIPQTAPGRYEVAVDPPRVASFAAVSLEGRPLDQTPLPGRYAAEFDAVGNDYDAMKRLAERMGGEVVTAVNTSRLKLPTPRTELSLTPHLALASAGLLALSLARWRWA